MEFFLVNIVYIYVIGIERNINISLANIRDDIQNDIERMNQTILKIEEQIKNINPPIGE